MKSPGFWKTLGGLSAAFTIGAQVFTASGAARTFPIPRDRPVATVDIPDSWQPTVAPTGVEGVALEGAVHLAVECVSAPDVEAASALAIKKLAGLGVVVTSATKRVAARHFTGSEAVKIDFSGMDPKGETAVTLILIAAPRGPGFISVSSWGDDEAQESVSNDMQSIADSLELVK